MLVKNFYTALKLLFSFPYLTDSEDFKVTNVRGQKKPPFPIDRAFAFSTAKAGNRLNSDGGIWVGSGAVPATVSDVKLNSVISDDSVTVESSVTSSGVDDQGNRYCEQTVRVVAKKAVTIAELGFFVTDRSGVGFEYVTSEYSFLIDRTVLDTPISMNPSDIALIKYRITNASQLND